MSKLDKIDRHILKILLQNGRLSNAKLAERINLSPAATHKRLRRLENLAYIDGYGAQINLAKLGYKLMCYVNISLQTHASEELKNFRDALRQMPEVLECSFVTGEFDYLAKVALRDQRHLEQFILEKITAIRGVVRVTTSLIVADIKTMPSPSILDL
ncbi:MAG: Lrp/AsnC family transcriptional regulator [Chloroflexota bacterium]